jgi:CBS domain-containing protein
MFEELTLKTAAEIMRESAPKADKDLPLSTVLEKIEKYKTDRAILTEDGKIRGILTYRDIIFRLGTVRTKQATPTSMHASSFMSEPVSTVTTNEPLIQALKVMDELGVSSVPVVEENIPQGIISRWELAELLRDSETFKRSSTSGKRPENLSKNSIARYSYETYSNLFKKVLKDCTGLNHELLKNKSTHQSRHLFVSCFAREPNFNMMMADAMLSHKESETLLERYGLTVQFSDKELYFNHYWALLRD